MTENQKLKKIVKDSSQKNTIGGQKVHMSQSKKTKITNTIIYILLVLISIIWLAPFALLVLESFKGQQTATGEIIPSFPTGEVFPGTAKNNPSVWTFVNYQTLFTKTNFPRWFGNTLLIALIVSVIQTLFVLSMSYCLSRLRFTGRKFLMNFMLILGMFPGFLSLILLYKVLSWVNMIEAGAIWGLIIVYTASSAMGYYVSKGFFDTISKSLDEAARVDGATRFQIFYKIIMPLSKPIIIYTVLTAFMGPWGDFMFATFVAHANQDGMNVAAGLQWLVSSDGNMQQYYTVFCAGGVLVAIPITLLFMFLQKYYVEGVTGGAVKG